MNVNVTAVEIGLGVEVGEGGLHEIPFYLKPYCIICHGMHCSLT